MSKLIALLDYCALTLTTVWKGYSFHWTQVDQIRHFIANSPGVYRLQSHNNSSNKFPSIRRLIDKYWYFKGKPNYNSAIFSEEICDDNWKKCEQPQSNCSEHHLKWNANFFQSLLLYQMITLKIGWRSSYCLDFDFTNATFSINFISWIAFCTLIFVSLC